MSAAVEEGKSATDLAALWKTLPKSDIEEHRLLHYMKTLEKRWKSILFKVWYVSKQYIMERCQT